MTISHACLPASSTRSSVRLILLLEQLPQPLQPARPVPPDLACCLSLPASATWVFPGPSTTTHACASWSLHWYPSFLLEHLSSRHPHGSLSGHSPPGGRGPWGPLTLLSSQPTHWHASSHGSFLMSCSSDSPARRLQWALSHSLTNPGPTPINEGICKRPHYCVVWFY